jgi:N-sulfoglucosamine sulfohydrolase
MKQIGSILLAGLIVAIGYGADRPNILWLTCEDISPYLGCYGFEQAQTPNLDTLAARGVRFTRAYANAPVCAVARSALLTGMHSPTLGTHQMRCRPQLPKCIPTYPTLFRQAGYYCTNNSKTDYNSHFETEKKTLWDETGNKAHWKNRPAGKPFFAVFNTTVTHESQLSPRNEAGYLKRKQIPKEPRVHPEDIDLPSYHPDLPEIRHDWARLHDLITHMDAIVGRQLKELAEAGLADDTIVFFYSDHGGQLSRSKRYIYNGGTQVPFIVHVPEKWQHLAPGRAGSVNDEIARFLDFPKTVLSLAGIAVPELMQGRILFGPNKGAAPATAHFYRDRMAERYDFSRAVTDGRYYFIRNFMPHRPRGRDTRYGPTVQRNWVAWEQWYDKNPQGAGPIRSQFFQEKPVIELFDIQQDPWEVKNLALSQSHEATLKTLQVDLDQWMIDTRDIGLIPEPLFYELIGPDKTYKTLYEYAQSDAYPIEKILKAAKAASVGDAARLDDTLGMMQDGHPVIRHWAAYGVFRARVRSSKVHSSLRAMIQNDPFAGNRIMAAQALGLCGDSDAAFTRLMKEAKATKIGYIFLFALNALQYSHTDNRLTKEDWQAFKQQAARAPKEADPFGYDYAGRIINDALALWPERRTVD